jgi:DNA-binding transcriptional LysR family regulator
MRLLEEELGVTLFTRGSRGMQLTEAGALLRSRIAGPLRQIGHAIYEVRSLPSETGGNVVFGMPPTMIHLLAGPLSLRVAQDAPNISLRIVDGYSGHLLEWIKRGELDSAILYGPTPAGLNATKLVEDELVLVGPPDSDLAPGKAVKFKSLEQLPLVLSSPTHGLRTAIEAAAAKARIKLNVQHQADSFQLMKELVSSGLGYTLLPYFSVSDEVARGRLTCAPVTDPPATRQLFLGMQSGAPAPRAVLQVEEFVRQEVASLIETGRWGAARLSGVGDS